MASPGGGATAPRGDLGGAGSPLECVEQPSTRLARPEARGCRAAALPRRDALNSQVALLPQRLVPPAAPPLRVGRVSHAARGVHATVGQHGVLGRGAEGLHAREPHCVPRPWRHAARLVLAALEELKRHLNGCRCMRRCMRRSCADHVYVMCRCRCMSCAYTHACTAALETLERRLEARASRQGCNPMCSRPRPCVLPAVRAAQPGQR